MGRAPNQQPQTIPSFHRSLKCRRNDCGEGESLAAQVVKDHLLGFVQKLQRKYPFTFAIAYRNLKSERNKRIQEKLTTHFLFGAISELSELPPKAKDDIWSLGGMLSQQIGPGGENFRPHEFTVEEKALAQGIGDKRFDLLMEKAEALSMALKFKMGPVNSAEHVISWSFRYVGQLLKAAKWESVHFHPPVEKTAANAGDAPAAPGSEPSAERSQGDEPAHLAPKQSDD